VEDPDYTTFPTFREAPPAILCPSLNPGDALYIPAKWWHHVRSLDTSASVNVWWR
jgi:lysine-specific demethylase 8